MGFALSAIWGNLYVWRKPENLWRGFCFMKIEKITLPIAILLSAIILAGGFYAVQYSKQRSIEKQQQIKIEQERKEQFTKNIERQEVRQELNDCLAQAEDEYNQLMKVLGQAVNDGFYNGVSEKSVLATFEEPKRDLEKNKAECFKKYPQK